MKLTILVKKDENGTCNIQRDVYNNCCDIYIYRGDLNFKSNGQHYFLPLKKVISIVFN